MVFTFDTRFADLHRDIYSKAREVYFATLFRPLQRYGWKFVPGSYKNNWSSYLIKHNVKVPIRFSNEEVTIYLPTGPGITKLKILLQRLEEYYDTKR